MTLDWKEYEATARETISEGCVLVKNSGVLPLAQGTKVSVFGRIQTNYYKSGTGSGGKVNVAKVYGIVEGLEESGSVVINKDLQKVYADWEKENPYDEGLGWGQEKWSQVEMPLEPAVVQAAARFSETAIVIIGRTAGEDKDNSCTEGSYLLTSAEEDMLCAVRAAFTKVIVLLNVGNIIDMSFVKKYSPDAVMYVWQGGMLGGLGVADLLTGKISPSGKLTDTIAASIADYPSNNNFGNFNGNKYCEDIFVGYRYFETFARNKVVYPFGYGLSYTKFDVCCEEAKNEDRTQEVNLKISVTNTGSCAGKEVVQIYVKAPCGKLGKADRVLVDFEKTQKLEPGQKTLLSFNVSYPLFSSYDDSGITGNKSCFVLEPGEYQVFAGTDVQSSVCVLTFSIDSLIVCEKCTHALAPVENFERMHNAGGKLVMENVPVAQQDMDERRAHNIPSEINQTNGTATLADVVNKKLSLTSFVAQFTDEDLACIVRGEGMGSSLVTPGTASAFGGVSPRLREVFGIPAVCCDDGPSGMRLDCGIKAFALPNGTLIASTFNCPLVTKLYNFTGYEMIASKVDNLLGPGMNIHRHPLNGRNFEYFSEDPFVTGRIGTAMIKGLRQAGVTGTIKHFCGNNQETGRHFQDSVISERALREIYLKGFEMAVKSGYANSVMTTYGKVNGLYTSSSYDLCTTILRGDWGFTGIVMTDWWANINERGKEPDKTNFAAMIRAQNDLYMVCPDGSTNASGDNTLAAIGDGRVTRAEVQRSAVTICNHVMQTQAMKRLMGTDTKVEIINRPKNQDDINLEDIESVVLDGELLLDLSGKESKMNASFVYQIEIKKVGYYEITVTANSNLSELAQLSSTFFIMGIPSAIFTFNGTGGKDVSISKEIPFYSTPQSCRLFVGCNGLNLKNIKFKFIKPL